MATDMTPRVFSVEVHNYDSCTHLGYFSTREKAEAYRDEYNELVSRDRFAEAAVLVESEVDEPRETLAGAWYAVLKPDDSVFSLESGNVFRPGEPARLVQPGYDDAPKEWGKLRQGFGLTRDAAIASALAFSGVPQDDSQ